jgi:ketosteroid isomerase-like protein
MSQENVEIVRRIYDGVNADRVPPELFDADYEMDLTQFSVDFRVLQGYDAAQRALTSYWETFEDFRTELDEVIHADERQVVTAIRDGGRVKDGDAVVWNRFFQVWTLRDGKAIRLRVYTDKVRALEAAGLRE